MVNARRIIGPKDNRKKIQFATIAYTNGQTILSLASNHNDIPYDETTLPFNIIHHLDT